MATKVGEIYSELTLRDKQFNTAIDSAKAKGNNLDSSLQQNSKSVNKSFSVMKIGAIGLATAVGAKLVSALSKAIDVSIEAEETFNKFSVVFKDVGKESEKVASELAKNFGLARDESQKLLANTGDLLTGFGLTGEEALNMSNKVNTLAVDLASFTNIEGGSERASKALTSALLGEREAAKTLGIVIREGDIQARLAAKGKNKLTGNALLQAKAEETLNIAYEQSKNAIGDYSRSKDSAANVNRRLAASLRDLQADVGKEISGPLAELKLAFLDSAEGGSFFGDALRSISEKIGQVIRGITVVVRAINLVSSAFSEGITNAKLFIEAASESGNTAKGYKLLAAAQGNSAVALQYLKQEAESGDVAAQKFLNTLTKKGEESQKAAKNTESALKGLSTSFDRFNETSAQREKRIAEERTKTLNKLRSQKKKATDEAVKGDEKELSSRDKFVSQINALGQSEIEKIRAVEQERLNKVNELQQKRLISEQQAADLRVKINEDANNKITTSYAESINTALGTLGGFLSSFSEISNLEKSNRLATLDEDNETELNALNERYDQEASLITKNVASQRQRDIQLKALEEKRAVEEKKLQEKQDKERRKIEREAAISQRNIAMFQTAVTIPQAAFAAYKSAQVLPFPASQIVGGALAAATTALGLKKLQLISQQPIPKLAEGGLALSSSGGFPAVVGDNPRFDEVVAPLNDSLFNNIGAGVLKAVNDQATIEAPQGQQSFNLTVNVAGERIFQSDVFYDAVSDGVTNGEIIIDA